MVNPLLGDISYESKFGHKPDATTDNNFRIRTHLEYVENLLKNKDVSNLSADLKTKRNHLLELLHNYWTNGIFVKNYDYPEQRKPCFINKDGNICGVGYLIEQTASRQIAEAINNKHKYDELLAMNNSTVDNWDAAVVAVFLFFRRAISALNVSILASSITIILACASIVACSFLSNLLET